MDRWKLDDLDCRLEGGETADGSMVRELIAALKAARSQLSVPAEFVVRVHRTADSNRWRAEHPLLMSSREAEHPADALILAGRDLRDALAQHGWPDRPMIKRGWGPRTTVCIRQA